jgi:hypothetical protein
VSTNPSYTAGRNLKKESQIPPYQNKSLEDMKDEFWQEIPEFEGFYCFQILAGSNLWHGMLKE